MRQAQLIIAASCVVLTVSAACKADSDAPTRPDTETRIAIWMPSRVNPARPDPLTRRPDRLPGAAAAEVPAGFEDERPIDIFSEAAIERAALDPLSADAVPGRRGNPVHFGCNSVRRGLSFLMEETLRRREERGLLEGDGCRELGEPVPLHDLTASGKLARKYPPEQFELFRGHLKLLYEPYPVGPVEIDRLGYPLGKSGR